MLCTSSWRPLLLLEIWFLCPEAADLSRDEPPYVLGSLKFVHADTSLEAHRLFGEAMGKHFAEGTRQRFDTWDGLQNILLPAVKTQAGKSLYETFVRVHQEAFPEYLKELEGIAEGAGIPFQWILVGQLQEEFLHQLNLTHSEVMPPSHGSRLGGNRGVADHCSDYMLCSPSQCVDGHNEDGPVSNVNRTFMVDAQLGGPENRFQAFVDMGELPTGAFGWNARGIGFSLNWVGPPQAPRAGLGRGFISRSMLDAGSPIDAMRRITQKGQCGGHNVQLFDFCGRTITNVEVAQEQFSVRPIGATPFFHANQYQTLKVPGETFNNSSAHRLKRISELPVPHNLGDILDVLGDQGDCSYPVFHDKLSHGRGELSDWTLATVVFDLDNRTVQIMDGNPREGRVRSSWDIAALMAGNARGCDSDESELRREREREREIETEDDRRVSHVYLI